MTNRNTFPEPAPRAQDASKVEPANRRSADRVPLTVSAELIEMQAGARITGRMADCSMLGCFVDTINSFPARTPVRMRLRKGDITLDADARVVFTQPRLGMGVAFTYVSSENRRLLES